MRTVFKYRLYPTAQQETLLQQTLGCTRMVYNHYLEKRIGLYRATKANFGFIKCLEDLDSYIEAQPFLADVSRSALEQTIRELDGDFKRFFSRPKRGLPKYRSKNAPTAHFTAASGAFGVENDRLVIPEIGSVKLVLHREIPEGYSVRSVTVTRVGSEWYADLFCRCNVQTRAKKDLRAVTVSFSNEHFITLDNGVSVDYPDELICAEKKLSREKRRLSNMEQNSKNRAEQRLVVTKQRRRVEDIRKDFLHKLTKELSDDYNCVTVNREPSSSAPERSLFISYLGYKLEKNGGRLCSPN